MKKFNIKNIYEWPLATRSLLIVIICAVVFYFAYSWDISSLKTDLTNDEDKERDLKQQLELTINKQITVHSDISQFEKLKSILNQWQNKLTTNADLPELMNTILKIGAQNQIYFAVFDPGAEVLEDIYLKLPIKVIAVGNYHQIADFFSQIANMGWIVVISQFNLSLENKNDVLGTKLAQVANTQHLLTAEMTLEVYRLAPAEMLKKPVAKPEVNPPPSTPPSPPAGGSPNNVPK